MWEELGISGGTALIVLIAMYFIIKWAVRNAIEESKGNISKAVQKGIEKYIKEKEESDKAESNRDEEHV